MKILLVHNRYANLGGEDSVFDSEQKLLVSRGHDVRALIFENTNFDRSKNKLPYIYKTVFNRNSLARVQKEVDEFQPDVIHVHNIFYMASPSVLFVNKGKFVPVIYTLHNYRLICAGATLMRGAVPCELCITKSFPRDGVRFACHRNSHVQTAQLTMITGLHKTINTWARRVNTYVALTNFAREKFLSSSLKLNPDQIVVKPNSVDDYGATPANARHPFYLYIGRLSTEKGIDVLLKAFSKQKKTLKIIGDGPLKPLVLKCMNENANIIYLGYQQKDQIVQELKATKALIVPSICYEGLPTTILESFSTGTPVIASDIGNLNTIVTDNFNGMQFKTNDPDSLNETIGKFETIDFNTDDFYANARATFLGKYTNEINYQRLMAIYQSAVSTLTPHES